MNFNDFPASLVTLFHIMVVNNWFITCDMITALKGWWSPRLFFISFWVLTVLIMLNLVISFVLEIYQDVDGVVKKSHDKQVWIRKLKDNFNEYMIVEDGEGNTSTYMAAGRLNMNESNSF